MYLSLREGIQKDNSIMFVREGGVREGGGEESYFSELCSNLKLKYLREDENFSKTILASLSGAQGIRFRKKIAQKSRDTATLKCS